MHGKSMIYHDDLPFVSVCVRGCILRSSAVCVEVRLHQQDEAGQTKGQFFFTFLTFSQTTNFRLFETERVCRRQF